MANPTYSLITSNTLSSNSTTGITWSNIPQTFDDLVIITNWTGTTTSNIFMRFNNDSTTNNYINMNKNICIERTIYRLHLFN